MFNIFVCLFGVFVLLVLGEYLGQQKILRGDMLRKFMHLTIGVFIATWPWLISWRAIQLIGAAMLLVVLANRRVKLVNFHSGLNRDTYGDIFFALAIIVSALMTDEKIFFAAAILIMAIGDSLAGVIGQKYGQAMSYKVFNHTKSVMGSMTMWFVSLSVLAGGLLFAHDIIDYSTYGLLLLLVPPTLVVCENLSLYGIDNLVVPVIVLLSLNLAS